MIVTGCMGHKSVAPVTARSAELHLQVADSAGSKAQELLLGGLFYETTNGRVLLPPQLSANTADLARGPGQREVRMPDGRQVTLATTPDHEAFSFTLTAKPDGDILRWGLAVGATADEYFTGLMERVVDGPQQASWAPGIKRP